ncbi:MAG: hypothetical protein K6G84_09000 [Lachnospiraceae bacterium]|nr:hypothetical protein [Lachnospiraceae bacterium]
MPITTNEYFRISKKYSEMPLIENSLLKTKSNPSNIDSFEKSSNDICYADYMEWNSIFTKTSPQYILSGCIYNDMKDLENYYCDEGNTQSVIDAMNKAVGCIIEYEQWSNPEGTIDSEKIIDTIEKVLQIFKNKSLQIAINTCVDEGDKIYHNMHCSLDFNRENVYFSSDIYVKWENLNKELIAFANELVPNSIEKNYEITNNKENEKSFLDAWNDLYCKRIGNSSINAQLSSNEFPEHFSFFFEENDCNGVLKLSLENKTMLIETSLNDKRSYTIHELLLQNGINWYEKYNIFENINIFTFWYAIYSGLRM